MTVNYTNDFSGANFSTTENGVTLTGTYRANEETHTISQVNFDGNVDNKYFNGSIDANGNVAFSNGVAIQYLATVSGVIALLYADLVARVQPVEE